MLGPDLIDSHHLNVPSQDILSQPFFAQALPLWVKNTNNTHNPCPQIVKRYEFTKNGKTLGLQTTRFISVWKDRLYYFDSRQSDAFLGSCNLENLYCRFFELEENLCMLYLSRGSQSCCYYFKDAAFYSENQADISKYVVQLDFNNQFQIREELGQGIFSTVFRAKSKKTGEQFAAKMITLDTPHLILQRELSVLRELNAARRICHYCGVYQSNKNIILLAEFVEGKELTAIINQHQPLNPIQVKTVLRGIAEGLQECKKKHIIHRDIKPQNIVVNPVTMEPTIIDFGMALDLKQECPFQKCGTLAFMAPQVYRSDKTHLPYGTKSDLYCLGVVAHIMMTGQNPLQKKEKEVQFDRSLPGQLSQKTIEEKWGHSGMEMVAGLLNDNPTHRWDSSKLLHCSFLNSSLEHKLSDSYSTIQDKRHSFDCGSY